jgi:hypothetical protein
MLIKKQVDCCLSKEASIGIKRENSLIRDSEQSKKIKLLFLYSFLLESYTCDDILPDNVLNNIINLCGCTECTSSVAPIFNIEAWTPDLSNYSTKWVEEIISCIKQPMKWIVNEECCITEVIVLPTTTLRVRPTVWIMEESCCSQNTMWIADMQCCIQQSCSCGTCKKCTNNDYNMINKCQHK